VLLSVLLSGLYKVSLSSPEPLDTLNLHLWGLGSLIDKDGGTAMESGKVDGGEQSHGAALAKKYGAGAGNRRWQPDNYDSFYDYSSSSSSESINVEKEKIYNY